MRIVARNAHRAGIPLETAHKLARHHVGLCLADRFGKQDLREIQDIRGHPVPGFDAAGWAKRAEVQAFYGAAAKCMELASTHFSLAFPKETLDSFEREAPLRAECRAFAARAAEFERLADSVKASRRQTVTMVLDGGTARQQRIALPRRKCLAYLRGEQRQTREIAFLLERQVSALHALDGYRRFCAGNAPPGVSPEAVLRTMATPDQALERFESAFRRLSEVPTLEDYEARERREDAIGKIARLDDASVRRALLENPMPSSGLIKLEPSFRAALPHIAGLVNVLCDELAYLVLGPRAGLQLHGHLHDFSRVYEAARPKK